MQSIFIDDIFVRIFFYYIYSAIILLINPVNRMVLLYSSAISKRNGRFTVITTGFFGSGEGQPKHITTSVRAAASVSFSLTFIFTCCTMSDICRSFMQSGMMSVDLKIHSKPSRYRTAFIFTFDSMVNLGRESFTSSSSISR